MKLNLMFKCRMGVTCLLVLSVAVSLSSARAVAPKGEDLEKVVQRVLSRAIIIDTHADTPQMIIDQSYDLADENSPFMISIPKMQRGHLGAEFFSIWVDVNWPPQDLIHRSLDLIDAVDSQVALHSDALATARTADDVERIHHQKKIVILMGVEGGHIIEDDLRMLDIFYRLGVRYMTLTHTRNTRWADSSGDKPEHNGLTDFGRKVVGRMNRLGMMVDISHVSDKTFYDAAEASKAPVFASHSSCRALCDMPRNMTDDMIRTLAKNGGVIDINFYSRFVDQEYANAYKKIADQVEAAVEAARKQAVAQGKRLSYPDEVKVRQKYQGSLPTPSFTRIADHIDHAAKVGGVEHVGLGSDFDGVDSIPRGMEDASRLPDLVRELVRRGYTEGDLEKILGGNLLRVMHQVEDTARSMPSETGGN